jgi:hypothetical protein
MKFRIVNNAWWMFWARGMVLWPWMWLRPVRQYDRDDDVYKAWWFQVRYGYKKNPFEVEANQRENDPLTEDEVRWREQGVVEL